MDNPHMFDELTNRLNKVKRPDSGIHNSGEFIGENEKEKADSQADSGRDSDPAELADNTVKKGGILKSFRKIFRIQRKSKSIKGKDKALNSQYKAASEPEMNTNSGPSGGILRSNTGMEKRYHGSPNVNDFISDDEEERAEEKKSKDAQPSFLRSSLRKLKLTRKKSGRVMESAEVTPTAVKKHTAEVTQTSVKKHTAEVTPTSVKKHTVEVPPLPAVSPKKSPKKPVVAQRTHSTNSTHSTHSTYSSHSHTGSDVTQPDELVSSARSSGVDSTDGRSVTINLKEDPQTWHPLIESPAAKDKIRVAPRGRKRPTRVRKPVSTSEKTPLSFISESEVDVESEKPIKHHKIVSSDTKSVEVAPKKQMDMKGKSAEHKIGGSIISMDVDKDSPQPYHVEKSEIVADNTLSELDSFITSLESIGNSSHTSTSTPKKPTPGKKPKLTETTITNLEKGQSRESIDNISSSRKSSENVNTTRRSAENIDTTHKSAETLSTTRKSMESLQTTRKSDENIQSSRKSTVGSHEMLEKARPLSVSLGDLIKANESAIIQRPKSVTISNEAVQNTRNSRDNLETIPLREEPKESSRYGKYRKDRSSSENVNNYKQDALNKSIDDVSVLNKENSRRSENFKQVTPQCKSSLESGHVDYVNNVNLKNNSDVIAPSLKNSQVDVIIPYGDSVVKELPTGKPRKLQKRNVAEDGKTQRKPRPQSVKIRAIEADVIVSKVSSARSYGDIRSLADVHDLKLANTGKSKSIEKLVDNKDNKDLNSNAEVLQLRRMSLKKTPKTDDFLSKEPDSEDPVANAVPIMADVAAVEENPVLASIKTTLKHVETKTEVKGDVTNDKLIETHEKLVNFEKKPANTEKETCKQLPSHCNVEHKSMIVDLPQEAEEEETIAPAFSRIALKKVEKRDDFLEKEPKKVNIVESEVTATETPRNDNTADAKQHSPVETISPSEVKNPPPSPNDEKDKPPVKTKKSFQFQSHDVKDIKGNNNFDKAKATPTLSQTNKLPYFKKSIDMQEHPNPNAVPTWIAMAKVRQRDAEENHAKESNEKEEESESNQTEDVKSESLVKPSALKSKPTLPPKPTAPPKPDASSHTSTSPPTPPKKPERSDLAQRPMLRFNAKTDLPKDACMVCGKTAYVLERMEVNKRTLHRSCAKCYLCSRTLNLGDIFITDAKVWCKQHR